MDLLKRNSKIGPPTVPEIEAIFTFFFSNSEFLFFIFLLLIITITKFAYRNKILQKITSQNSLRLQCQNSVGQIPKIL